MGELTRSSLRRGALRVVAIVAVVATAYLPARAGLVVRYTFDEASSGNTTALNVGGTAGAAANGVFNGTATRTSSTPNGYSLGALSLNTAGAGDFVGPAADVNAVDALSAMTVSMWINVQSGRGQSFYVPASDFAGGGLNQGWLFYYVPQSGDTLQQLGLEVDASATEANANVNATSNWRFIAVTWDTSGALNFYTGTPGSAVTQVGTTQLLAEAAMADNSVPLRLSGYSTNPTTAPNAFIDDFRVYDNVLNASQLDSVRLENLPEPASLGLLALGGLMLIRRR